MPRRIAEVLFVKTSPCGIHQLNGRKGEEVQGEVGGEEVQREVRSEEVQGEEGRGQGKGEGGICWRRWYKDIIMTCVGCGGY